MTRQLALALDAPAPARKPRRASKLHPPDAPPAVVPAGDCARCGRPYAADHVAVVIESGEEQVGRWLIGPMGDGSWCVRAGVHCFSDANPLLRMTWGPTEKWARDVLRRVLAREDELRQQRALAEVEAAAAKPEKRPSGRRRRAPPTDIPAASSTR